MLVNYIQSKRLVVGFSIITIILVILFVLSNQIGRSHNNSTEQPSSYPTNYKDVSRQDIQLNMEYFRNTTEGKMLWEYFACEDLDCIETGQKVVNSGSDVVPVLIKILQGNISSDVPEIIRIRAKNLSIISLGSIKDPKAIQAIYPFLQDTDPSMRASAVDALGSIGGKQIASMILPLLNDEDEFVREKTTENLELLNNPLVIPELKRAASLETQPRVRKIMEDVIISLEKRVKQK